MSDWWLQSPLQPVVSIEDVLVEQELIFTPEVHHTPSQNRAFINGTVIDSGQAVVVTGSGNLTTREYADGYIANPVGQLTYIYIPMNHKVRRAVQHFRGPNAVISITNGANLTDRMLHVEFGSGVNGRYWFDGLSNQVFDSGSGTYGDMPDLNDGQTHKLEVEVVGEFLTAYVDGEPQATWRDPIIKTIYESSSAFYCQILNSSAKIYGMEGYSGFPKYRSPVQTTLVSANSIQIGSHQAADFNPDAKKYIHLDFQEYVMLDAPTGGGIEIVCGNGYNAEYVATNFFGHKFQFRAGADATGQIWWQGGKVLSFANGTRRPKFETVMTTTSIANPTDAASTQAACIAILNALRTAGIIPT